jgi:hypothetical protein
LNDPTFFHFVKRAITLPSQTTLECSHLMSK